MKTQYLNEGAAAHAGVPVGHYPIPDDTTVSPDRPAELIWREYGRPKTSIYRCQEWSDELTPSMRGTSYTILQQGKLFGLAFRGPGMKTAKLIGTFFSAEDAKRAAQADFDANK